SSCTSRCAETKRSARRRSAHGKLGMELAGKAKYQTQARRRLSHRIQVKSGPVILDMKLELSIMLNKADANTVGGRIADPVLGCVGQQFIEDQGERHGNIVGQSTGSLRMRDLDSRWQRLLDRF